MSKKMYRLNNEIYHSLAAEIAKLPKQQQLILKTMYDYCTDTGMAGSEIIRLAIKDHGLETRQKHDVLYAWYARSNEKFGVYLPAKTVAPVLQIENATQGVTDLAVE